MKSLESTSSLPGGARTETRSVKTLREYSSHINTKGKILCLLQNVKELMKKNRKNKFTSDTPAIFFYYVQSSKMKAAK